MDIVGGCAYLSDTHKLWEFNHAPSRSGCGPPHLSAALTSVAPAPNGRFPVKQTVNRRLVHHRQMAVFLFTPLFTCALFTSAAWSIGWIPAWIPALGYRWLGCYRVCYSGCYSTGPAGLQPLVYRPKRVNRSVNFSVAICAFAGVVQIADTFIHAGNVGLLPLSGGRCRRITGPLPAQWPGGLASWASAQFCAQLRRGVFPQKGENPCSGGLASWVSVQFCTHADPPKYGIRPHFNCCRYDHSYPAQWPGGVAN